MVSYRKATSRLSLPSDEGSFLKYHSEESFFLEEDRGQKRVKFDKITSRGSAMNGIFNIDKPSGPTSFDIVSKVRKLSGERRVGHAGTLDPTATGVLPVCLGQGTRVIEFLVDTTKSYRAVIELGVATDTYDAAGVVTLQSDSSGVSRAQLDSELASFSGSIEQVPPLYSALKHQGKPLYELARAGIIVEMKSRPVTIHSLELVDWQPPLVTVEVVCGKGTYIRSLAHDLGQNLGCGAHLKNLVRLRCGPFDIKDAVSIPELENAFRYGYWQQFVYPIDSVFSHWTAVVVSDDAGVDIRSGRPLVLENESQNQPGSDSTQPASGISSAEHHCRAYALDGRFLAVLHFDPEKGHWRPQKVFV
jgi:tRNA pseudouridine55 synthase